MSELSDERLAEIERPKASAIGDPTAWTVYAEKLEAALRAERERAEAQRSPQSYEREIASLSHALAEECKNSLRLSEELAEFSEQMAAYKDEDDEYSPVFQDEYRRLWHDAAQRAEKAEEALREIIEQQWEGAVESEALEAWHRWVKARARAALHPEAKP